MQVIDYQQIVNIAGMVVATALPIGIVFAIAEKVVNGFLSMAFGERKIRL